MPINWDSEPAPSSESGGGQPVGGAWGTIAAGFNKKAVGSMASEAKEMLNSAKSGGFTVSPEAAEPIRKVLQQYAGEVKVMSERFADLSQVEPALGEHPYGKAVAEFQRNAATTDDNSPARVLEKLSSVLEDADEALGIAMSRYRESEESAASSVNSRQV